MNQRVSKWNGGMESGRWEHKSQKWKSKSACFSHIISGKWTDTNMHMRYICIYFYTDKKICRSSTRYHRYQCVTSNYANNIYIVNVKPTLQNGNSNYCLYYWCTKMVKIFLRCIYICVCICISTYYILCIRELGQQQIYTPTDDVVVPVTQSARAAVYNAVPPPPPSSHIPHIGWYIRAHLYIPTLIYTYMYMSVCVCLHIPRLFYKNRQIII